MSDDVDDSLRLTVPSHVVSRETGGETVLLSLENEQYFALEGAGNRLWEHVSSGGGVTVGELIAKMQTEFDVDPLVLADDVHRMVQALTSKGLITAV